jgi:ABC-type glycerol-3-phosphate transport system permease component
MTDFRNMDEFKIYIGGLNKSQLLEIVDKIDKVKFPERYDAALNALARIDNYIYEGEKLEGFGGWLLIYSLYAGIISPYKSIYNINYILNASDYLNVISQKFNYILLINILNELWIGIIGMIVAYLLARENKKVRSIIFIYLWGQMIFRLLVYTVPLFMGLPWSFLPGMQDRSYRYALYGTVFIGICLFYFMKSKRFNNTYSVGSGKQSL